eukprot:GHVS01007796.1.p2 GENE.GHVS01007796.1~~GHVS01007796.1.p2  ORF type:complete len:351 (+),score=107.48 GHVS01007796.1:1266-2318(+)
MRLPQTPIVHLTSSLLLIMSSSTQPSKQTSSTASASTTVDGSSAVCNQPCEGERGLVAEGERGVTFFTQTEGDKDLRERREPVEEEEEREEEREKQQQQRVKLPVVVVVSRVVIQQLKEQHQQQELLRGRQEQQEKKQEDQEQRHRKEIQHVQDMCYSLLLKQQDQHINLLKGDEKDDAEKEKGKMRQEQQRQVQVQEPVQLREEEQQEQVPQQPQKRQRQQVPQQPPQKRRRQQVPHMMAHDVKLWKSAISKGRKPEGSETRTEEELRSEMVAALRLLSVKVGTAEAGRVVLSGGEGLRQEIWEEFVAFEAHPTPKVPLPPRKSGASMFRDAAVAWSRAAGLELYSVLC